MADPFFGKDRRPVGVEYLAQGAESLEETVGEARSIRRAPTGAQQQPEEFGVARLAVVWFLWKSRQMKG
jgi:hypothetical protein